MNPILFLALAIAEAVFGQSTRQIHDPLTNITFETYDLLYYRFGIALPQTDGQDFVGQIHASDPYGVSWAGVSLSFNAKENSAMKGPLIIAAWNDGGRVRSSFRRTTMYSPPTVYNGPMSMRTIPSGTSSNNTHLTYTFVCSKCITGDNLTFKITDQNARFGFAYSSNGISNPSSPTAGLQYHGFGTNRRGSYNVNLAAARRPEYSAWAAMAN